MNASATATKSNATNDLDTTDTMHENAASTAVRRRRSRHLGKVVVALALAFGALVATTGTASAETDRPADQCVWVHGVARGCARYLGVTWGSGIRWHAGGQLEDVRADYWSNTVEIMLDRKWPASNTNWIRVLHVYDWQTHTNPVSASGYDPTDGAWIRLCSTELRTNTKWCAPSRYYSDNS